MPQPAKIGLGGYAPSVKVTYPNPEKEKYVKMWAHEEYRNHAPGEAAANRFLQIARPAPKSHVIDFGCGTGRGAILMAILSRCDVTLVDFAENCLDETVKAVTEAQRGINFLEHDLTKPLPITAEYGLCSDVMEHIPEKDVPVVLENILKAAKRVFFSISTVPDSCGKLIGETLHMTVKDPQWWAEQFAKLNCMYYYREVGTGYLNLYVSGWASMADVYENSEVNQDIDTILGNVRTNITSGYKQVEPHAPSGEELMLLLGGPSLNDYEEEIIEKRKAGVPLITVNGTYQWAIERGMNPSALVMVDAREWNKRFITQTIDDCQYLINSQCHPDLVRMLPKEQVWLWHSNSHPEVREVLDTHYDKWFPVYGGCTVGVRSLVLLRMLGWKHMHIYGFDSCFRDDAHHAYAQPENDNEYTVNVLCNGRSFRCSQWMAMQAEDFKKTVEHFGSELQLAVYGDGLIANILKEAASTEE